VSPRAARESVAQQIVGIIRELGLQPGDAVPTELDLIARLDVSRNTVREAVRELRAWGIVEIRHGHGTFVAAPSLQALTPSLVFGTLVAGPNGMEALHNLARIREILEASAVTELAGQLTAADQKQLLDLCERIGDPAESADADRRFHQVLYGHLSNPLIGQLVDVFWDAYHEVRDQLVDNYPHGEDTVDNHRRIVRAIADGDGDEAARAMHIHFRGIYERLTLSGLPTPAAASPSAES
jgi:DNA-binding FadR family transcriptional regulator